MKGIDLLVGRLWPGARVRSVTALGTDVESGETEKGAGYGHPVRIRVEHQGATRDYVFHTQTANDFGHDRRADRAGSQLLAWDTFGEVEGQARAVDVGAIARGGELISLADSGELYLLTEWVPGDPYAADLRRIAESGVAGPADLERVEALARYLVSLHRPVEGPAAYARAIRDLVGHGEGIFGIIDGYGDGVPGAPLERLHAIERRCLEWRWKLRGRSERLRRTHGDFHPFNVVFQEGARFRVLDASRGSLGDAADDVAAMAVNFPFFSLERPRSWARGLGPLWRRFFRSYLDGSRDRELYDVIAPFFAWRALVVSCPKFYPHLRAPERDALLGLAERALGAQRFDPEWAEELFP
jgi:hypothetical protein